MSLVGRLMATLGLDSRGFVKGLNDSESRTKRFAKSVARYGAAAVASIAGVGISVGRAAEALVDLDNQARLAGEGAERFKVLTIAADEYGIGQEKLADILKDVNDKFGDFAATGEGPLAGFFDNIAPKVGVTMKSFEDLSSSEALQLYVSSLEKAGVSQQEMTFYMEALASDATALLPVFRDQGAALQTVTERAQALGLTLDQETLTAAREAKREFGIVSEVLRTRFQAALASLIPFLVSLANVFAPVVSAISGAFSQLVSIAAVAAAAIGVRLAASIGVRFVASAVAATRQAIALELALGAKSRAAALASVAVKGLSRALRVLRGALVSTGIGALVVAAGLLVDQFVKLVQKAGGLGNALSLLWDVAKEAFRRIGYAGSAAVDLVHGGFLKFLAASINIWSRVVGAVVRAAEAIVDAGTGAADAFKAAFKAIPGALGDFMFQAANSVIDGVEGMINAVVHRINSFIEGLNDALALLPEWAGGGSLAIGLVGDVDFGGVNNPFEGQAEAMKAAVQEAFEAAQGKSDFGDPSGALRELAAGVDASAAAALSASKVFKKMATAPLSSIRALRTAMQDTEDGVDDTSDAVKTLQDELDKLDEGGGGDRGKGPKDEVFDRLKTKINDVSDSIAGVIVKGGSLRDTMRNVFQQMAQDLVSSGIQKLMMNLFGFGGAGGGGGSAIATIFGSLFGFPSYARGTMNHPGGVAQVFEKGGEILDLPNGTRVIPHDLSSMMVTAAGKAIGAARSPVVSDAKPQEHLLRFEQTSLQLTDDGKIVAEIGVQTDQKISRAGKQADQALPRKVRHITDNPRDRFS